MSEELCVGPLMVERARAAGITVEARAIGSATVLTCAALPHAIGYNRAYDVDRRDHGDRGRRAPLRPRAAPRGRRRRAGRRRARRARTARPRAALGRRRAA